MTKHRWSGVSRIVAGSLLFATLWGTGAHAAPGDVDTTFGTGGKVGFTTDFPYATAASVAIQSDGKIVAGGLFVDFNTNNGTPEGNFGLTRRNAD